MKWKRWVSAVATGGLLVMTPPLVAAPPAVGNAPITVVVEGTGRDEEQARKAALREAVSQAVGTLIDAETVVRNDQLVKDQIVEFSGGFVKSFETLSAKPGEAGGVRVRIRATVERLRLFDRPVEAKSTARELNGADLLATKQTREDARRAATELLAQLYADVPKLAKAEVKGEPKVSRDGRGLMVDVVVSADPERYAAFARRATAILDRVAAARDGIVLTASRVEQGGHFQYRAAGGRTPQGVFSQPPLDDRTPPGYAVWLATPAGGPNRLRWALYWVDAEPPAASDLVGGSPTARVRLEDVVGDAVAEDVVRLTAGAQGPGSPADPWLLGSVARRSFKADGERRSTASVFLAPVWSTLDPDARRPEYRPAVSFTRTVPVSDADLRRVRRVTATVEFEGAGRRR
jgi:hypothetical protein